MGGTSAGEEEREAECAGEESFLSGSLDSVKSEDGGGMRGEGCKDGVRGVNRGMRMMDDVGRAVWCGDDFSDGLFCCGERDDTLSIF